MKTKKEILKWWEDLGRTKHQNDLNNFYANRDAELKYKQRDLKLPAGYRVTEIILKRKHWKFPIKLYFNSDRECYRIVGF